MKFPMDIERISHGAVLPACALILILLAGGVIGHTSFGKLILLAEEKDTLSTELTRLTELQTTVIRGEKVLEGLGDALLEIEQSIPGKMDFQSFYSELISLTRKHGVVVSQIEPKEAERGTEYDRMKISLSAESSFLSFFEFMSDLKGVPRMTTLEQVDIKTLDEGQRCAFELILNIYAMTSGGGTNG